MKMIVILIIATMGCIVVTTAQTKDKLHQKALEVRASIEQLNKTLQQTRATKSNALQAIKTIQHKMDAKAQLIQNLNKQVKDMDETIYQNELEVYRLKQTLTMLKTNYAKSIVYAYKNRSELQQLNFVFASNDFNDAWKRMQYLKNYRSLREIQLVNMQQTQALLAQKLNKLNDNRKEQTILINTQQTALKSWEQDKQEKHQVYVSLKGKEQGLQQQIKEQAKQQQKIAQALNALIKKQDKKTTTLVSQPVSLSTKQKVVTTKEAKPIMHVRKFSVAEDTHATVLFDQHKGSLPWPVSSGTVIVAFGDYHVTKEIKGHSDGIDIALPIGSSVKCVAEGVVTWARDIGDQLVVFVKHGNYYTVYTCLSAALVHEGQVIHAGAELGKSGADFEGKGKLGFMVRKADGGFVNPAHWLKPSR